MLSFLKRIFGAKPAVEASAPYKVEEPGQFPFPKAVKEEKPAVKAKRPAVRAKTARIKKQAS